MDSPDQLPLELFTQILNYAWKKPNWYEGHLNPNHYDMCRLALLNHRWYAAMIPRLYSERRFEGDSLSFLSLWRFLRTILTTPFLARLVQTVVVEWICDKSGEIRKPLNVELPEAEVELIRKAIRNFRGTSLESSILDGLYTCNCEPLLPLLLASLPNLRTLYAQIPDNDLLLSMIVQYKEGSFAFRHLETLYLKEGITGMPIRWADLDGHECVPLLRKMAPRPPCSAPWLPKLSSVGVGLHNASFAGKKDHALSGIRELHISTSSDSQAKILDLEYLLALPLDLARLRIHWRDEYVKGLVFNKGDVRRFSVVWSALQQQRQSLKAIDIYVQVPVLRDPCYGHFGSFKSFPRLKNLTIQIQTLLGSFCKIHNASFCLKDALPATIESLAFYDRPFDRIDDLGAQLNEVLCSGLFPCLKSIVVEDYLLWMCECLGENMSDNLRYMPTEIRMQYSIIRQVTEVHGASFTLVHSLHQRKDFCFRR